jgi:dethiobiotin synthetase
MTRPLVVVTGTGTEIGKTVVASGLIAAWAGRGRAIAGIKPIESGVAPGEAPSSDVGALDRASTFHVTHAPPPYMFRDPVSPHLAARREGREIDPGVVVAWVNEVRRQADGVVLELPGGLFSPLTEHVTNADVVARLAPTAILLVAPDRLGVIHDVVATARAARSLGLRLRGIVLSTPAVADASTGTNAAELERGAPGLPVLTVLPRARGEALRPYFEAVMRTLQL